MSTRPIHTTLLTLTSLVFVILILSVLASGVVVADHENTSANNGPVYTWLYENENFTQYGTIEPSPVYFNGSFLSRDAVYVLLASERIDDPTNDINNYSDLSEELKDKIGNEETLQSAYACESDSETGEECDEEQTDKSIYKYVKSLEGNRKIGQIKDYTFSEPLIVDTDQRVQQDINRWNWRNSFQEWGDMSSNGNVLPEDEHYQRIETDNDNDSRENYYENPPSRDTSTISASNTSVSDSWTAATGMSVVVYSNDPSVWTHTYRYSNIPKTNASSEDSPRGAGSDYTETDNLFDRSYKQIGDSGTLRLVYNKGSLTNNAPSQPRNEPTSPADGDTRWKYTGGELEVTQFSLYIRSLTGTGTCSRNSCPIDAESVSIDEVQNGVVYFDWNLSDSRYDVEELGGERVQFIAEVEFKVSYDKRIEEADRYCADRADEDDAETRGISEGDCIDYDIDWDYDSTESDFVTNTKTLSTEREYYFTDGVGEFKSEEDLTVKKAEFPNGRYRYYVKFDQETASGDNISWNKITGSDGSDSFTAHSQWKYFGSRDKAWDDLYDADGNKYSSTARPLRIHAYPAYEYYNTDDSTGATYITPNEAETDDTEIVPSPALIGHETCVQNYPKEYNQSYGSTDGTYEYHEPCYWYITSSGQYDIPIEYYDLPHTVGTTQNGPAFRGNQDNLEYKRYIFDQELSESISGTDANVKQELYSGTYRDLDEVVFDTEVNTNTVTLHGMVPETQSTEEVDETITVSETFLSVDVQKRCRLIATYEQCTDNPIDNDRYNTYTIEITLTRMTEDGEREPVNTTSRSGELIVNTHEQGAITRETIDTNEEGEATIRIYDPPDDSDVEVIDVIFEPETWRTAEDPLDESAYNSSNDTFKTSNNNWLLQVSSVILIIALLNLSINKGLERAGSTLRFAPVKHFAQDNIEPLFYYAFALAIVFILAFRPSNTYEVMVLIISLLLLRVAWNQ